MPPGGTALSARRAFNTGKGHKRPVASSVSLGRIVASPVASAMRLPRVGNCPVHLTAHDRARNRASTASRRVVKNHTEREAAAGAQAADAVAHRDAVVAA